MFSTRTTGELSSSYLRRHVYRAGPLENTIRLRERSEQPWTHRKAAWEVSGTVKQKARKRAAICQKITKSHLPRPVPFTAEEKALGSLRAAGPASTLVNFLFVQYVKLQQYSRVITPTCVVPVPAMSVSHTGLHICPNLPQNLC